MKKITIICFLSLLAASFTAVNGQETKLLTSLFGGNRAEDALDKILVACGQFEPFPRSGSAFWRDSIPQSVRRSYIEYGERYLGVSWPVLPVTEFARFKTDGNRTGYERLSFARRRALAALVVAEIAEGRHRFVPDIVNGLQALLEETWWGIPAHYDKPVPVYEDQTVDLFNAETAGLVAWTSYMLRAEIDSFSPLLRRRIDSEIDRRLLRPALKTDYWWKRAGMNWNPWIASNWLACVLICEHDRDRQLAAVAQIMTALDTFTDSYPADGGCDEGPNYWDRAAASLFDCLNLLRIATDGRVDIGPHPKIRAMAGYAYKLYVGDDRCVNFADAGINTMALQLNVAYPFGRYTGDSTMTAFASHIAVKKDFANHAADIYDRSGNWPALARELFLLRDVAGLLVEPAREPLLADVWLPDLQIMTARRRGLYVAMKGGTNGESHNHNDVGSFIVYCDNRPVIVDPGVGSYTAKTFGRNRYDIWTMQSQYHNLPVINGMGQRDGAGYAASAVRYSKGRMRLDIAGAYPAEAGVRRWIREVRVGGSGIVDITEDYELTVCGAPPCLVVMAAVCPDMSVPGRISLGSHAVLYNPAQLSVSIEPMEPLLDDKLRGVWGDDLYRIVMTVKGKDKRGKIRWRFSLGR